ncbi:MAG: ABC transporter permease [Candidatus Saccharicenans sp.]|nr:MAG: ABC transporter permease [Candidatus Aminicenantes bacterium]HEK86483.1 ABC transporter permease [Candidatus Aminicenantes bacterium]
MKNFSHLLIKEIKELINKQLVISLVFILIIFNFIGGISKTEMKKAMAKQKIAVLDLDKSEISRNIIGALNLANFIIEEKTGEKDKVINEVRHSDLDLLVVIPAGFGQEVTNFHPGEVETYSFLRGISMSGSRKSEIVKALLQTTNDFLSNEYLKKKLPEMDPKLVKAPIKSREFIVVKDRTAEGSSSAVIGSLYAQSFILPVILMMIIMYSSQMVITAIAMEKQNKTLETLLTVPISRTAVVLAKMLAAGIVGLLSAAIYLYGFRNAFSFSSGDLAKVMSGVTPILKQLGLVLNTPDYVIFGLSLFLTILVALSLATVLGVLAEDYRTAQSLNVPLVFLVLVPYFISLFADINTMSLPAKILVLAIPFSHPFFAMQNIMFGHLKLLWAGIGYNFLFMLMMLYWTVKIFSTDRVLTMKLKWGKKRVVI